MSAPARLSKTNTLSADDWRLLVESVQDYAIFMLDPEGHIASWNRGAEAIKGYTASEVIGSHFSRFYEPEDLASGLPERELAVARAVGRVEQEGFRIRKDGGRFWANVVITALRDESGTLRGFTKVTRDLTARRASEEALRRSEERFRLLMEAVDEYAIYVLDPEGNVSSWNTGAEKIKGYRASEIIGKNFALFFPEEDVRAGRPVRELEIALTQGRFSEEGYRVRKDGTRFWASVVVTPIRDGRGVLLGFAKVTRDLTLRVEAERNARMLAAEQAAREVAEAAEAKLRESEERYRALSSRLELIFEGLADGVAVQDRSGRIIFANKAGAEAMGFRTVEDCMKLSMTDVAGLFEIADEHGQPIERDALPGRRVLRGELSSSMLMRVREVGSGREWWRVVKATGVNGSDGLPELAITIWHDVTEDRRRERAETYLAKASAALAESLDYGPTLSTLASLLVPGLGDWCSIYLLDGEQVELATVAHTDPEKVKLARDIWQRYRPRRDAPQGVWSVLLSGVSQLHPQITDAMLVSGAQSEEHLASLREVGMNSALTVPIRVRDRVLGALSLVSSQAARAYDAEDVSLAEELGRRAGGAIENARLYAAQKKARAELEVLAQRAEEANRLKDEFLATVSHELRTPLNAILGWASVLLKRNQDPGVGKAVEIIHRNALVQGKIIEDILDTSRIITGKLRLELKSTDLNAIVLDAMEVLRPSLTAKDLTLSLAQATAPCTLVADPERLQQVVWNVLSNAVKFSEPGGTIHVSSERAGSLLTLTVRDAGRGIAPEFLPFVFDRFKQADGSTTRRVGGLGLGLAIVRHLVDLHGGHVEATSPGLGLGATFRITLPVRAVVREIGSPEAGLDPAPPQISAPLRAGALAGTRVVVVDDESDARELLATVLSEAGAQVETAPSAAAGFEALKRFRPHVLVSDIGMPTEDGYSFMQRVKALPRAEGGDVPGLALTAYTRTQDRERALAAGFSSHLGKPVDADSLVREVCTLARAGAATET